MKTIKVYRIRDGYKKAQDMDERIQAQLVNGSVNPPVGITYELVPAPRPFMHEDIKVKELVAKETSESHIDPEPVKAKELIREPIVKKPAAKKPDKRKKK